jgi:hypothetical protein
MTGRPFCISRSAVQPAAREPPNPRRTQLAVAPKVHVLPAPHPIAHGPGPPHRPHIGPSDEDDDDDFDPPSDDTAANTLSARAVSVEPQSGHGTFSLELIDRTSFSNFFPHGLHWYS